MSNPSERPSPLSSVSVDMGVTVGDRGHTTPERPATLPTAPPQAPHRETSRQPEGLTESGRLGRYHLRSLLGQGGMGSVYGGYDPELDRRVALKILHRGIGGKAWLLREGQALARLSHPHVVGIHEVGEHDGHVFLSMEYVDGASLRQWLTEKQRPVLDIVEIFLQAGRGLVAAHQAGLVHRDFKPDNVLIGTDGRVRVGDFGIATAADRHAHLEERADSTPTNLLESPLTRAGNRVGTPAFMSPEQFAGDAITPQSDQWSFCVALYEAVYGVRPFAATTVRELQQKVLYEKPTVPAEAPDSPWLGPILLRGLARDPAQRFPSMSELLKEIEQYLPRDPELDPRLVIRERLIMSVLFVSLMTLWGLMFLYDSTARMLLSPAGLLNGPAAIMTVMITFVVSRWRGLLRNRYGRRLAALSVAMSMVVLFNHLVGMRLGLPGTFILVEDLVLMGTYYTVVACTMEPWIGWLGLTMVGGAIAGALHPEKANMAFGVAAIVNVAAMAIRVYIDRHLKPEELAEQEMVRRG